MKKVLVAIFAHPDDEAFGPSGTLLKLHEEGYDLHLILLTNGEGGQNPDGVPDLGATRLGEWQRAAVLLGATSTTALHYPDGSLEQIPTIELDDAIRSTVSETIATYPQPVEILFMTFEPNGLTGHRDHISVSESTQRISGTFQPATLWYFCLDSTQAPLENTSYYQPRSRDDNYITKKIDISAWLDAKHAIMDTHISQRADAKTMKALGATECFHIESV